MAEKNKFSILITGTPGTGKTFLAKEWCKRKKWKYISLNGIVNTHKLYAKVDKNDGAKIVKLAGLEKAANSEIKKSKSSFVVEGHLGCDLKLNVGKVLVLRLHPYEIEKRLAKRNYQKFKLGENMMAETLDYCTINSEKNYGEKKVFEIDATKLGKPKLFSEFEKFVFANEKELKKYAPKADWTGIL